MTALFAERMTAFYDDGDIPLARQLPRALRSERLGTFDPVAVITRRPTT